MGLICAHTAKDIVVEVTRFPSPEYLLRESIKEREHLKAIFADNGYPTHVGERIVSQSLVKNTRSKNDSPEDLKPVFIRLPWVGVHSIDYSKEIRETIVNGFPQAQP